LERARGKHNKPINSNHEGYAVLLEEYEEAFSAVHEAGQHIGDLWECIKNDDRLGGIPHILDHIRDTSQAAIIGPHTCACCGTTWNMTNIDKVCPVCYFPIEGPVKPPFMSKADKEAQKQKAGDR
jgi:rubrerythrin